MTPLRHDAMYSPWGMVMWDSHDDGWPSATNLTHQKILVMYDVSPKNMHYIYLYLISPWFIATKKKLCWLQGGAP